MLEIKKEMIDKAIEKEKSNREKSEKLTAKAAIVFLVTVFVEIFLLVVTSFCQWRYSRYIKDFEGGGNFYNC